MNNPNRFVMVMPDGTPYPDFAEEAFRGEMHQREIDLPAPAHGPDTTPPNETYRPLAGAQPNSRGNTQQLPAIASLVGVEVQSVASICQTTTDAGADAESITVTLGYPRWQGLSPNQALGLSVEIVANISFGIGGIQFECDIDWVAGASLTIPASFIKVAATVTYNGNLGDAYPALNLDAALSYGGRDGGAVVTKRFTIVNPLDQLASNASRFVQIPPYAVSFGLAMANSLATDTNPLAIEAVSGSVSTEVYGSWSYGDASNDGFQDESAYALPLGTQFLVFTNKTGSKLGNNTGSIIFALGL